MRVEINMRPYPEQKPPAYELVTVMLKFPEGHTQIRNQGQNYLNDTGDWREANGDPIYSGTVIAFALPEDIIITEEKREV